MLRNSLAARAAGLIMVGAGLTLFVVVGTSDLSARRFLERELEAKARYMALATANRMEILQRSVEKVGHALAREISQRGLDPAGARELLRAVVRENPEVYGASLSLEPRAPAGRAAAYVFRRGAALAEADLASASYDYTRRDWYTIPRQLRRPTWSEPYFDRGGGEAVMATYSVPLLDASGGFRGITGIDVDLDAISRLLSSLALGASGYGFMISHGGAFVAHPDRKMVLNKTIFSLAEERGDPVLHDVARRMVRGESGFVPVLSPVHRSPGYLAFTPIRSTGSSLGLLLPRKEAMAPVQNMTEIQVALGAIGFAILLVVVLLIARTVTRPLRQLTTVARQLGSGRLDVALPELRRRDEIGELAASFSAMQRDLRLYVRELETTTAAKERIEGELRIARDIQMGLVPQAPSVDLRAELELFALLEPAREVGGDFYDFFFTDEEHLALVIADVAGKGVPAALMMAQTHALARVFAHESPAPATVLSRLNEELSRDNDAAMFVTLFYASLSLKSGRLAYGCAGHPSPFLLPQAGEVSALPRAAGVALGAVSGVEYGQGERFLAPGDLLLLYTDGVTEAMNPASELYADARVAATLERLRGRGCKEVVGELRASLRDFAAGAPQSDDIAMLALRFRGAGGRAS